MGMKTITIKKAAPLAPLCAAAVLVYPVLHELGHILAALLLGCGITEFRLWPVPSVMCGGAGFSPAKQVFVGLAGGFLPAALSLCPAPKRFLPGFLWLLLRVIGAWSMLLHGFYAACFRFGLPAEPNDAAAVLSAAPELFPYLLLFYAGACALLCRAVIKSAPLRRAQFYFYGSAVK